MPPVQDENKIAARLKAADQSALKTLYCRYYPPIKAFLFHRTRNIQLAEDLAQDTFFRLWESREKIQPGKSLKSYLYQIANHLFIDYTRRVKVERRYTRHRSVHSNPSSTIDMDISVQTAVDHLPEKYRVVFILSRAEGFSYREIAQTLNVSIKTVEHRIYRALDLLKKELED